VAVRWGVQLAEILRVASFYDEFRFDPIGRHVIEVCTGTSCYARGSGRLIDRLNKELGIGPDETDKDGRFTLRTVRCLGLCGHSPSMKIDGRALGRVNCDRLPAVLEQFA
jgi:NADH-quinone oxidoreductase subunit E